MKFLTEAKQLATYFRESVSFSLWDKSYDKQSVVAHAEELYALVNKEAFVSLLRDCVDGKTLTEIFVALYDQCGGIPQLVDCNGERIDVWIFLQNFVENDGARFKRYPSLIYTAINTWLLFYGLPEISERTNCPICGTPLSGGTCPKCNRKSQNFLECSCTLAKILKSERDGQPSELPEWWKDIVEGSEFYVNFVEQIKQLRYRRSLEYRVEHAEEIAATVAEGTKLLQQMRNRLAEEQAKGEVQNYDEYLDALSQEPVVNALATEDVAFAEVCKKYATDIRLQSVAEELKTISENFCTAVSALYNEYNRPLHTPESLQECLSVANDAYKQICTDKFVDLPMSIKTVSSKKRYENGLADNVNSEIQRLTICRSTAAEYSELCSTVDSIRDELVAAKPEQGLYDSIKNEYNQRIVKNSNFNTIRAKRADDYSEAVGEVEEMLQSLGERENEFVENKNNAQFSVAKKNVEDLYDKILKRKKSQPTEIKVHGKLYKQYIALLRRDKFTLKAYNTETTDGKTWKEATEDILDCLAKEIKSNIVDKKKRMKKAKMTTIFSVVVIAVLFGVLFLTELSGVLPVGIVLPSSGSSVEVADIGDGFGIVTRVVSQKQIVIPRTQRPGWAFSEVIVTEFAGSVFLGNREVEQINLPSSIKTIPDYAFANCTNLVAVVLNSEEPPKVGSHLFDCKSAEESGGIYVNENVKVYVPQNSYEKYLAADGWSNYANLIFADIDYSADK